VYGLTYKYYHPKGKLYLKLDAYNAHLAEPKRYAKSVLKNGLFRFLEKRFLKKVDLVSVENKTGLELAKRQYPGIAHKIQYIPNGCNDLYLETHFEEIVPKENTILSVGRMGGEDKNYELVLRALPNLKLSGWKMILVGPMSETFENKWKTELAKNPSLSEVINFLGPIYDRPVLYSLYQKSKVFFLPSRFESFGISFTEAMYFGNVLVGHKGMSAYDDLTQNGAFGTYYEDNDAESFSRAILEAMKLAEKVGISEEIRLYTKKHFYWSSISDTLSSLLKNG
jgi:glycosyltransferase involved in cell wall biosynthesis